MKKNKKSKILFLCTGNSCRSQMAEGWTRHLIGEQVEAWSAGIIAHGLDHTAVKVMAEAGVDISRQKSKSVWEVLDLPLDCVITVCDHARENCPLFPRPVRKIHKNFDDPPSLARSVNTREEVLTIYRRVRDEIKAFVETLPGIITDCRPAAPAD